MSAPGQVADRFVRTMSSVCTPVAVVTALDGAFASRALAPPMVLVAHREIETGHARGELVVELSAPPAVPAQAEENR